MFRVQKAKLLQNPNGSTWGTASNPYIPVEIKKKYPNGLRLDHIMYKHSNRINVDTTKWFTCFDKIPEKNIHYSDHLGVCAEFNIQNVDVGGSYKKMRNQVQLCPV